MRKLGKTSDIEMKVLDLQGGQADNSKQSLTISQNIKSLGIELSRKNPVEWNAFMTACLESATE